MPIILILGPAPIVYERHYLQRGDAVNGGESAIDFDVVTEIAFFDRAAFESWSRAVGTCVVHDHVTAG